MSNFLGCWGGCFKLEHLFVRLFRVDDSFYGWEKFLRLWSNFPWNKVLLNNVLESYNKVCTCVFVFAYTKQSTSFIANNHILKITSRKC